MSEEQTSPHTLKDEGLRLFQEGLYLEAADRFDKARQLFVAEGDQLEATEMVNNLGIVHRMERKWDEAVAALEEAREGFAQLGDRSREAQVLGNLGGLYASQGQREAARINLREAATAFADLKDNQRQAETLLALGVQKWKTGDRQGALATYQAGLQILERPSFGQKILRILLQFRAGLLGGV